jgi:hypothetical protein
MKRGTIQISLPPAAAFFMYDVYGEEAVVYGAAINHCLLTISP